MSSLLPVDSAAWSRAWRQESDKLSQISPPSHVDPQMQSSTFCTALLCYTVTSSQGKLSPGAAPGCMLRRHGTSPEKGQRGWGGGGGGEWTATHFFRSNKKKNNLHNGGRGYYHHQRTWLTSELTSKKEEEEIHTGQLLPPAPPPPPPRGWRRAGHRAFGEGNGCLVAGQAINLCTEVSMGNAQLSLNCHCVSSNITSGNVLYNTCIYQPWSYMYIK